METKIAITKLDKDNYEMWAFKMQMLLTREEMWDTVEGDAKKSDDAGYDKWKKL